MGNELDVPLQAVMPAGPQLALIALTGLGAIAVWVYAILESRRRRDLVPVFVVAGSGLAVWYEALGDAMAKVYYSEQGQLTWVHAFGRDIPVFIGLLYFWYMSLGALWLLRASRHGVPAKRWWRAWGGYLAFAITLEMVVAGGTATPAGAPWQYYGHQAFMVFGVPFFTPFTYVSIDVAIALGVIGALRVLPRGRQWLLVALVPMLMVAGHAMTALPSALAVNTTDNPILLHLGALGSAAFAVLLAYLAGLVFRNPWPPNAPAEAVESNSASNSPIGVAGRAG
jgi:hypothetical protein